MSVMTQSRPSAERPLTLVGAVALSVLTVVATFATLPLIPDDAPSFVLPLVIGLAVVTAAAAWFLWQCRTWAAIVIFVISAFNILTSLPAPFADEGAAFIAVNITGIVISAITCWLLLTRSTRGALRWSGN